MSVVLMNQRTGVTFLHVDTERNSEHSVLGHAKTDRIDFINTSCTNYACRICAY